MSRNEAGRLFQIHGPATAKLLSPNCNVKCNVKQLKCCRPPHNTVSVQVSTASQLVAPATSRDTQFQAQSKHVAERASHRCPSTRSVSACRLHPSVGRSVAGNQRLLSCRRRWRRRLVLAWRYFMARPTQSRSNPHPSGCLVLPSVDAGVKLRYMTAIERRTCAV